MSNLTEGRFTRDCRRLTDYIRHFKKYNRKVNYKKDTDFNTIGIIEDRDGELYFCALMYGGRLLSKQSYKIHVNDKNNDCFDEFMKRDMWS